MKKRFDINEIYEDLNEAVIEQETSHAAVLDMFRDFIQDTIFSSVEFQLDESVTNDLENISKAIEIALQNKNLNK